MVTPFMPLRRLAKRLVRARRRHVESRRRMSTTYMSGAQPARAEDHVLGDLLCRPQL